METAITKNSWAKKQATTHPYNQAGPDATSQLVDNATLTRFAPSAIKIHLAEVRYGLRTLVLVSPAKARKAVMATPPNTKTRPARVAAAPRIVMTTSFEDGVESNVAPRAG